MKELIWDAEKAKKGFKDIEKAMADDLDFNLITDEEMNCLLPEEDLQLAELCKTRYELAMEVLKEYIDINGCFHTSNDFMIWLEDKLNDFSHKK